jgi:hypothetical protein
MSITKKVISISIDTSLLTALEVEADKQRRPMSWVIQDILLGAAKPVNVPAPKKVKA